MYTLHLDFVKFIGGLKIYSCPSEKIDVMLGLFKLSAGFLAALHIVISNVFNLL